MVWYKSLHLTKEMKGIYYVDETLTGSPAHSAAV